MRHRSQSQEQKSNIYYVYIYYDPRVDTPLPMYVGKGKGNRANTHLNEKQCSNSILLRKIKNIRSEGYEPIVKKVYQNLSNIDAINIERKLILQYGRIHNNTGILCNFTDGGEGTTGYTHTKETLKLLSNQRLGKKQTPAQYNANCNRVISDETRKKMSMSAKGQKRHSDYQLELLRNQEYGAKTYLVIFPDGTSMKLRNLSKFCRDHNLDRTSATKSIKSNNTYKGYKFYRL